ncbi:MAG: urease accessory protein UreF [Polyangiaceae bacterium]
MMQLADSSFPTGGFAHSAGLEAAVALGEVRTAEKFDAHVRAYLWNVGHASLPFVAAAHEKAGEVWEVDALLDAMLTSHVTNRASRTQGRTFLATCARVFDEDAIQRLASSAGERARASHLAPVFGATLRAVGIERRETLAIALYAALRSVASAAIRLGVVGPHEAQRLVVRHGATMDDVLAACEALGVRDAATVSPLIDIFGATHDRLYARLFQS